MILRTLSFFSLLCGAMAQSRTFIDDRGTTHTISGKPTIVVRAGIGARSLYDYGMSSDQVVGVYGTWFVRGSDMDLNNPSAGSLFPDADPTAEQVNLLRQATNLSPGCYDNPNGCFDIDFEALLTLNPDFFVYIDNGNLGERLEEADIPTNVRTIFIDTVYEGTDGCRNQDFSANIERCTARSSIDIAKRIEELAVALGTDIPSSVKTDKKAMCDAAAAFSQAAQDAHNRDVRVAASVLISGTNGISMRLFNPIALWDLRTMEELGLPILHAGDEDELNAVEYLGSDEKIPADFWLFDSRNFPLTQGPGFSTAFPDQAVVQGQYWHWLRGDGAISYRSIATRLNRVAQELSGVQRTNAPSLCTPVDVTSDPHNNIGSGGLARGQYACYDQDSIDRGLLNTCLTGQSSSSSRTSTSSGGLSKTAAVGIIVGGSLVVLLLIALLVARRCSPSGKEFDTSTSNMEPSVQEDDSPMEPI